jgi:hypothetical protein
MLPRKGAEEERVESREKGYGPEGMSSEGKRDAKFMLLLREFGPEFGLEFGRNGLLEGPWEFKGDERNEGDRALGEPERDPSGRNGVFWVGEDMDSC